MIKIEGKKLDLGGGFLIHRLLPVRQKRMVGPFIFFDHMGPFTKKAHQQIDVRPHPHIGLSTFTYMLQGRLFHQDSIGVKQVIQKGGINWMTSGKGIVHSERVMKEDHGKEVKLEGLQFWVALPKDQESQTPSFQHFEEDQVPEIQMGQYSVKIVAGTWGEEKSPLKLSSPLGLYFIETNQDCELSLDQIPLEEFCVYFIQGEGVTTDEVVKSYEMVVFSEEVISGLTIKVKKDSKLAIFGGTPFPEKRYIWWNFVSSDSKKIEEAKKSWKEQKFDLIPDDQEEFIPLPERDDD